MGEIFICDSGFITFNSLSRDHRPERDERGRGRGGGDFQLPLSGSLYSRGRTSGERELSTPSLGITIPREDILDHAARLSTPSLGITDLGGRISVGEHIELSTPSLGITGDAGRVDGDGDRDLSTPSLGITK
jgi:hypothetical protein